MIYGRFIKAIPHSYKNTFLAIGGTVQIHAYVLFKGKRHYLVQSNAGTPEDFRRESGAGALMQWGATKEVLKIFDGLGEAGDSMLYHEARFKRLTAIQNKVQTGNRAKLMWVVQDYIEVDIENKESKYVLEKVE